MPLTTLGPSPCERSHSMSATVTDGSKTVFISPITSSAAPSDSKASGSVVTASNNHRGFPKQPARLARQAEDRPCRQRGRNREPVVDVPVAGARHRDVHSQDERPVSAFG